MTLSRKSPLKRGRMKRSAKSRSRRKLIAILDARARQECFERDNFLSAKSGKAENLQWCHIFSRRDLRLRWHPANALTLTAGEHMWWHHEPAEAIAWFIATFPERYAWLMELRQTLGKVTLAQLRAMVEAGQ